ncbi:MAG TPA: flavin-dependent oxidoreductase, partial [Alphaproteobacteria bacterium]|nr:flavin-dependent oxidoreductase [Alphaproteobacteria bacterium]
MTQRPASPADRVIIAGGGIGGFATALTLQQIGVPCLVIEQAQRIRPLGVGINLQPNAIRELMDLGFTKADLDSFGVPAQEWALVGMNGQDIYAEPRGTEAGYHWPQYAAHRGQFQMALYDRFRRLAGDDCIQLTSRVTQYAIADDGRVTVTIETPAGERHETGGLLIGADGIHSAIR